MQKLSSEAGEMRTGHHLSARIAENVVAAWWTILQGLFRSVTVKAVDKRSISLSFANM